MSAVRRCSPAAKRNPVRMPRARRSGRCWRRRLSPHLQREVADRGSSAGWLRAREDLWDSSFPESEDSCPVRKSSASKEDETFFPATAKERGQPTPSGQPPFGAGRGIHRSPRATGSRFSGRSARSSFRDSHFRFEPARVLRAQHGLRDPLERRHHGTFVPVNRSGMCSRAAE